MEGGGVEVGFGSVGAFGEILSDVSGSRVDKMRTGGLRMGEGRNGGLKVRYGLLVG